MNNNEVKEGFTEVLKAKVNQPKDELGQGKIVDTIISKSTGKVCTETRMEEKVYGEKTSE